ncbi:relaxin family locus B precursor [Monodelphis domestica]|uniref:Relaxin family locus B n=1 Tax=Monodelphis domestica TaxID=13616 RepID=B1AAQ9_MONDO|nr:relaxin family locus B precursor [Monodelphis domestica]ACA13587.1 relaxin family locus B [Monodelphis domestica]
MLPSLLFSHLLGVWLLLSFFPGELGAQKFEDTPMKLCGREFIRAVIFTCGGSRWKRISMMQKNPEPQQEDQIPEEMFIPREFIPGWKEGQIPLPNRGWDSLKNMLYDHNEDSIPTKEEILMGYDEFKEAIEKNKNEIKAIDPLEQYDFMWGTHTRKKRDSSTGIADYCCQVSCTKNDIAKLC